MWSRTVHSGVLQRRDRSRMHWKWRRYTHTRYRGNRRWIRQIHRASSTCLSPLHSMNTTFTLRMMVHWQWWSTATTTRDLHPGIAPSMTPSHTCCGASWLEWWHTLRWSTCSCLCPTYTRWWQLHTTRWAVDSIVDLCRWCSNMSSDTFSTLQNMAHKGYYASLWIGWGSYSSTATPVAMCGTSTFPWMYNMFCADQRLTQYMQLWPWHYIMQARHCPDSCPLLYSMDCCSTQLSSPYTWRRTSMRMKILVHKIHGTSYRPRFQDLQLQLHCQELHPRPPWVHPDLQWWRALQGWICEVHGWILLQFSYNGFWLHVSNSAWIHPSDTILATRCLYINTALRFSIGVQDFRRQSFVQMTDVIHDLIQFS